MMQNHSQLEKNAQKQQSSGSFKNKKKNAKPTSPKKAAGSKQQNALNDDTTDDRIPNTANKPLENTYNFSGQFIKLTDPSEQSAQMHEWLNMQHSSGGAGTGSNMQSPSGKKVGPQGSANTNMLSSKRIIYIGKKKGKGKNGGRD